ncbi:hypothetical protein K438DRAFT_1937268 [Mycena galopus ATCC 62051]|nr:hypothetical protein K438DRAFT_1937268 [Mycena galopus ATCC 62051]
MSTACSRAAGDDVVAAPRRGVCAVHPLPPSYLVPPPPPRPLPPRLPPRTAHTSRPLCRCASRRARAPPSCALCTRSCAQTSPQPRDAPHPPRRCAAPQRPIPSQLALRALKNPFRAHGEALNPNSIPSRSRGELARRSAHRHRRRTARACGAEGQRRRRRCRCPRRQCSARRKGRTSRASLCLRTRFARAPRRASRLLYQTRIVTPCYILRPPHEGERGALPRTARVARTRPGGVHPPSENTNLIGDTPILASMSSVLHLLAGNLLSDKTALLWVLLWVLRLPGNKKRAPEIGSDVYLRGRPRFHCTKYDDLISTGEVGGG